MRVVTTPEVVLENNLIAQLVDGESQWTYRPDLQTEEDLWENFKEKLENNNKDSLNGVPLTKQEFTQTKNQRFFTVIWGCYFNKVSIRLLRS